MPNAAMPPAETPHATAPYAETTASGKTEVQPPLRVTLDFTGECWTEAAVDGEQRVAEIRIDGESLQFEAERMVELKVGDVDAVRVEVNGHPFQFEEAAGTRVREQRIDLETVDALRRGNHGE